jgi:hypothetical protein
MAYAAIPDPWDRGIVRPLGNSSLCRDADFLTILPGIS